MQFYTKTADWRSPICNLEGVNVHFGVPIYILEAELEAAEVALGVLYRQGGIAENRGALLEAQKPTQNPKRTNEFERFVRTFAALTSSLN